MIQRGSAALILLALTLSLSPWSARGQLLADISHELVSLEAPAKASFGKYSLVSVRPERVRISFDGVAFSARTNDPQLAGQVRFLEGALWSDWKDLYMVRSATDDVVLGGYRDAHVKQEALFELRFTVAASAYLHVTGAGVFDTRLDEDVLTPSSPSVAPPIFEQRARTSEIEPPRLITRADWNAEPFIGTPVPLAQPRIEAMTFHHAAGFSATTLEQGLAQVKAIQDLHQNVRGWSDIGYQFVIDRSGRLYQGRPFLDNSTSLTEVPELAQGAHVGGHNTGNIGVCILGCYHPSAGSYCQDELTAASYETYVTSFAFFSENYGPTPQSIRGHRDWPSASTACPGDNNHVLLPQIREDVEVLVEGGGTVPERTLLAPGYPNPFVSATTIRYYLAAPGSVTLKVYNAIGEEVAVLAEGYQEGESWYTTVLPSGMLSSGTYFCRLEVTGIGDRVFESVKSVSLVR